MTNESKEYLARREELRIAEIELMKHREKVAGLRRALPQGAILQDYEFLEGPVNLDAGDEPVRSVKLQPAFHRSRPAAGDLPPHVWQEKCQAMPNVHDVD